MSRLSRFAACLLSISLLPAMTGSADAQRRAVPRHPPQPAHPTHPAPAVAVRGPVFIGGYFYDPFFGPYPWWPRQTFPYWYVPIYDTHATLRLRVTPDEAAVYVDGFYAGIVDDFDSFFEGLTLTAGGHRIVLYLQGYRTVRQNLYLGPGSSFTVREALRRLAPGEKSETPELAPPVPVPPDGTYSLPRTPPPVGLPQPPPTLDSETVESGTLDLFVQPADSEVTVDGQRWLSSDSGHFVVRLPAGRHRIEMSRTGYRPFATTIDIRESQSAPLNVVLMPIGSAQPTAARHAVPVGMPARYGEVLCGPRLSPSGSAP